jgi:triphosphoribosyl-dephospho-CoA synthase
MRKDFFSSTPLKTPWTVSSDQARAIRLAALARQALIAEAELTPKPGLVDRRGTGAHSDLSLAS